MIIDECRTSISSVIENINRVLVGKEPAIEMIVAAWIAGGNVLLEDLPGTGKTVLAKSLARSVDAEFSRIQFTPDLLPSDVTGLSIYDPKEREFVFRPGPVFTNILLADEINRATPRTQSALLESMEEKQVTTDGVTRVLPSPFLVIATQNPIETAGTYPLPEAQLDRFMIRLSLGLPDVAEEVSIMQRFLNDQPLDTIKSVISKDELARLQASVNDIYIHPDLLRYIASIAHETRVSANLRAGVSTRGTLAMVRLSRAYAMVKGREYVIPEDIKSLAVPAFAHRLVMAGGSRSSADSIDLMNRILDSTEVPTEDWSR